MMPINYDSLLYAPVHGVLGVDAILTANSTIGPKDIVVIDKTSGVPTSLEGFGPELNTIRPAAVLRISELSGSVEVPLAELTGGIITFNGKTWRIESYQLRPSPGGEADGEVWLFLIEGS